jgi:uncharacterized protein DUF6745
MLPAPQVDELRHHFDRWSALGLSCHPADRSTAERGIRLAYAAANLAPPERIIWCGGPMEIADQLVGVSCGVPIGVNVKHEIFDSVRRRVGTLTEIFWKDVLCGALELNAQRRQGAEAIDQAVVKAVDAKLARFSVRARHAASRLRGRPRLLPKSSFDEAAIGPGQLASLAVYEYLRDATGCKSETRPLRGLWKIAASGGWLVPHEHVCWVSERPDIIRVDAEGRLHSADGAALRYRDGWSVWFWKGVEVPAWAIEHPERITLATLDCTLDPVLRRCLIEIMTPERLIASGGAKRLARDETGTLWGITWQHRGVTLDKWKAVEVVDGTPELNGPYRHYVIPVPANLRTAREAVAWTYGLSAAEYADLQLRT